MQLQDQMMADKETKMQVLRIRKEHLEEETAKGEAALLHRSHEIQLFLKLRDEKVREKCGVEVVQTWWRQTVAAQPRLLMVSLKSSKKKKKKKKV